MIITKFEYICACCGSKQNAQVGGVHDLKKTFLPDGWGSGYDNGLQKTLYFCSRGCIGAFREESFKETYQGSNQYCGLRAWHAQTCDNCKKESKVIIHPAEIGGGPNNSFANWYSVKRLPYRSLLSAPGHDKGAEADLCSQSCLKAAADDILKPYQKQ